MFKQISGIALALAVVGACSDRAPTSPGHDVATTSTASLSAEAGVVSSVNGAGHQWASAPGGEDKPALRNFSINAKKKADGTVTGHYNVVTASGLHASGKITCLNVVGDRAFIGAEFETKTELPFTVVGVALEIVGGGNGPDAVDQISALGLFPAEFGFTEDDVQAYCDDAIEGPVEPIDLGSIHVR